MCCLLPLRSKSIGRTALYPYGTGCKAPRLQPELCAPDQGALMAPWLHDHVAALTKMRSSALSRLVAGHGGLCVAHSRPNNRGSPMSTVCITWENAHLHGEAWISHHRLRYRIFVERQGWAVPTYNGLEYDEFDTPAARYIL